MPHKASHDVNFGQVDTAKPKDPTVNKIDDEVGAGTTKSDHEPSDMRKQAIDARLKKRDDYFDKISGSLSRQEIELAAKPGRSIAQREARQKLFQAYEAEFGNKTSIGTGMDFNKPMRIVKTPPPNRLSMWRNERFMDGHGNFYDPTGGASTPSQLGINSVGRQQGIFRNEKPGLAFEGYGAPIVDDWSVYGSGKRMTEGGTRQFHIPNDFKPEPADRVGNLHNWRDLPGNKDWVQAEKDKRLIYDDDRARDGREKWYLDGPPIKETGGVR